MPGFQIHVQYSYMTFYKEFFTTYYFFYHKNLFSFKINVVSFDFPFYLIIQLFEKLLYE